MTPGVATIWMAVLSIFWYVGLTLVSQNALYDSILSIGIFILLYYGMTGLACVVYFRHELTKSVRHFVLVGVVPLIGAIVMTYILVKSIIDLSKPENSESGASWLGLGPAARDRDRVHDPRRDPDAVALVQPSRVLPAQARGRGSGGARCLETIVLGYDDSPSANAALARGDSAWRRCSAPRRRRVRLPHERARRPHRERRVPRLPGAARAGRCACGAAGGVATSRRPRSPSPRGSSRQSPLTRSSSRRGRA